jgi:hypothetical protein
MPGLFQTRHGIGIPILGSMEIPTCPVRESHEACGRPTHQVIVLTGEVMRPPGMAQGAGHITEDPVLCGTVEGYRTG